MRNCRVSISCDSNVYNMLIEDCIVCRKVHMAMHCAVQVGVTCMHANHPQGVYLTSKSHPGVFE